MGTVSMRNIRNENYENVSVPPGFVSLTSLSFKRALKRTGEEVKQGARDPPLSNSEIEEFKSSFTQRPWLLHDQIDRVTQTYGSEPIQLDTKCPARARLPVGVIKGCSNCNTCIKVTGRWHPEESRLPELDDAPVFRPTEEEFKDTLKYIAEIRPKAEKYGMCRIVPPPSWRPPCLYEDSKTWGTSKFGTQAQRIDELQNLFSRRKLSELHEKMKTTMPNGAANMDLESCIEDDVADSNEAKCADASFEFESGPEFTLKSFEKYDAYFKKKYFSKSDKVTDPNVSSIAIQGRKAPLIARIEGEYWRIIENPSEEIEVFCGTKLGSRTWGSGFLLKASPNMAECSEYVKSGWNLNNTPKLPGSILPFGCDASSSILVPQLFIGMCFASEYWRSEDHHLYSLYYMHSGAPRVCYSVPGRYYFKFLEVVKKQFPHLSGHPELLDCLITQLSPSTLKSEGIPVYRCVQNRSEFVLIFPGAFHSEFSCGFNCSESVCFAPFDWLPHGQNIVELYSQYCLKTSISHDRLLVGGAMDAVHAQWESVTLRKESFSTQLWKSAIGKDGIFTKILKSRVKTEDRRREHLCNPSLLRAFDEFDVTTKRECIICFYDLYFSAVGCSCSPNRYTCFRHAKQLCSCPWGTRHFLFRYSISELNLLIEALEGNLKAIHSWAKRKVQPVTLLAPMETQKNHIGINSGICSSTRESNGIASKTSDVANYKQTTSAGENVVVSPSPQNVISLLSDDEE